MESRQIGNASQRAWIGCSGYVYKHWRGRFYPEGLPASRWLEYYAQSFDTVEINNTHYTMPSPETFERWRDTSPEGFRFAVKASRFITHMKKLKDPDEPLALLIGRARLLEPKLGPILYQLPPRWRYNEERLRAFLAALPQGMEHTIEVRETSWLNPSFFQLLEESQVAFCMASLPHYQSPIVATAPFVYIRFHGSGAMYYYRYTSDELRKWRDVVLGFLADGKTVYCYFNNDPEGWAIENARELIQLVREG
ncbi:MAG: DUF72 domain-containing protein [Chloroflexota bacterium]